MLPPALGGLRVRVPPIPGHPAPGSMSKITLRRFFPWNIVVIPKIRPSGAVKFWQNLDCGNSAAQKSDTMAADI